MILIYLQRDNINRNTALQFYVIQVFLYPTFSTKVLFPVVQAEFGFKGMVLIYIRRLGLKF